MLKSGLKFNLALKKTVFLLWTIFLRLPKTNLRFSSNLSLVRTQICFYISHQPYPFAPICIYYLLTSTRIFSTVNCFPKGSQVRILAQTNIFFIIFIIFYLKMHFLYVKMSLLHENVINRIIFA